MTKRWWAVAALVVAGLILYVLLLRGVSIHSGVPSVRRVGLPFLT